MISADGVIGKESPPERLGLFGGTFDPPHCGHLAAAVAARDALQLDRVLMVVANDPWQKSPYRTVTPAVDRLAMVEAAVEGLCSVEADRSEIDRGGPTYTVDTVESQVAAARSQGRSAPHIFLVVGSDVLPGLSTWERVAELRRRVTLAVVSRPGAPVRHHPRGWEMVEVQIEGVDISSSQVKARLEHGESVEGMVPDPVIRCIRLRHLYAGGR